MSLSLFFLNQAHFLKCLECTNMAVVLLVPHWISFLLSHYLQNLLKHSIHIFIRLFLELTRINKKEVFIKSFIKCRSMAPCLRNLSHRKDGWTQKCSNFKYACYINIVFSRNSIQSFVTKIFCTILAKTCSSLCMKLFCRLKEIKRTQ